MKPKSLNRIMAINLSILLGYSLILRLLNGSKDKLSILLGSFVLILLHVVILLFISLAYFGSKEKEAGRAYLLSCVLILLIGFGVCWGNASI